MHTITLFGAGKIGEAICGLLTRSGRYEVRVCDHNLERARHVAAMWSHASGFPLDLKNKVEARKLLQGSRAVISALPYYCNTEVATLAKEVGCHYFDLTEDVETSKNIAALSQGESTFFVPQCGLAPGFISVAANFLINSFDKLDSVKMRVGALPLYPSNRLKYNLTWSTEGLINEYGNMCEVISGGKRKLAFPLEGYERFSLDGDEYEAFNTSGGLGTLCATLEGRINELDYKSVRYPGHREYAAFLMQDLRFNEDRETLKNVFERSISTTTQDKCLIFVEARGQITGHFVQKTYASVVYNDFIDTRHFGAIQLTTAAGVCAPLDMLIEGKVKPPSGFVRCEELPLLEFLNNEFGRIYKDEKALRGIAV